MNSCRAARGEVVHTPTGRRLSYGALVDEAAGLSVPRDVSLKHPKAFKLIGTPPSASILPTRSAAPRSSASTSRCPA